MKAIRFFIPLLILLLVSPYEYGQTELENKVISTLLNKGNKLIPEYKISKRKVKVKTFNRHKIPEFVMLNVTKSPLHEAEFDTLSMIKWKVLTDKDKGMLQNFCKNNNTCLKIDSIKGLKGNITYLDNSRYKKIFQKKNGWNAYYEKYGLKPFVNVSRPGFNEKKNKALIYMTYSCGKKDGAGYYLVMKKSFGKWKVKGPMLVWVLEHSN
jgi:hypothetical protein